ncbi:radical SAM protein, partial [Candidatus Omnitrophota bacterium]
GVLGDRNDEHVESKLIDIAREKGIRYKHVDPQKVLEEFKKAGIELTDEERKFVTRIDHANNSINILDRHGIVMPKEVRFIISRHMDVPTDKELESWSEEERLLFACFSIADTFECGNSYYKRKEGFYKHAEGFEDPRQDTLKFTREKWEGRLHIKPIIDITENLIQSGGLNEAIQYSRTPIQNTQFAEQTQRRAPGHAFKAVDGFKAAIGAFAGFLLWMLGGAILYMMQGDFTWWATAAYVTGMLYLLLAAWTYYRIGGATYEVLMRYRVDHPSQLQEVEIARDDGYRHPRAFGRLEELSPKEHRLITIHEGFESHFWGMVMMLPVLDWFQGGRYEASKRRAALYKKAQSDEVGEVLEAAPAGFIKQIPASEVGDEEYDYASLVSSLTKNLEGLSASEEADLKRDIMAKYEKHAKPLSHPEGKLKYLPAALWMHSFTVDLGAGQTLKGSLREEIGKNKEKMKSAVTHIFKFKGEEYIISPRRRPYGEGHVNIGYRREGGGQKLESSKQVELILRMARMLGRDYEGFFNGIGNNKDEFHAQFLKKTSPLWENPRHIKTLRAHLRGIGSFSGKDMERVAQEAFNLWNGYYEADIKADIFAHFDGEKITCHVIPRSGKQSKTVLNDKNKYGHFGGLEVAGYLLNLKNEKAVRDLKIHPGLYYTALDEMSITDEDERNQAQHREIHSFKAIYGYAAGVVSLGLSIIAIIAGAVFIKYMDHFAWDIVGVVGFLAMGVYLMFSAGWYFYLGRVTYYAMLGERLSPEVVPGEGEGVHEKIVRRWKRIKGTLTEDIAKSNGYRHPVFKRLPKTARDLINFHESYKLHKSHFIALLVLMPGGERIVKTVEKLIKLLGLYVPRKKVLLIASPLNAFKYRDADRKGGVFVAPPFGLYRLKSYLKGKKLADVEVFDPNLYSEGRALRLVKEKIASENYDIIGFGLTHVNMREEFEWIESIKETIRFSGAREPLLLGGGIEATHNYKEWLKNSSLNGVVLGYGEKVLERILRKLKRIKEKPSQRWFENIPATLSRKILDMVLRRHAPPKTIEGLLGDVAGLTFIDSEGTLIKNSAGPITRGTFKEITFKYDPTKDIPYQNYWDHNRGNFDPENLVTRNATLRTIRLFTSSHCPNRCDFCSSHNFLDAASDKEHTPILYLSAEGVFKLVLQNVREHAPDAIFFNDDDFIIDNKLGRKRVLEFCRLVKRAKKEGEIPADLKFYTQTKTKNVTRLDEAEEEFVADEELLREMKEAGFVLIALGVESFSDRMLKSMNKKIAPETNVAAVEAVNKAGIIPLMNIILLPPDITEKDFLETAEIILKQVWRGAQLSVVPLVEYYPGAAITEKVKQGGHPYYRSVRMQNKKTAAPFEYPVSFLPKDEKMRKAANDLEKHAAEILNELRKNPEWNYRYPPQLIRGLTYIAAVYRSLGMENRVVHVKRVIWQRIKSSKRTRISARLLTPKQFDYLIERSHALMEMPEMTLKKASDLLVMAGDLKEVRPYTYGLIVDHLSKYLEGLLSTKARVPWRKKSGEEEETEEDTLARCIAEGLAKMDFESKRTERLLALLNFHGIAATPILNDYYVDSENLVFFESERAIASRPESIDAEFAGGNVMVFEPHHDDALIHLGNTLEKRVAPKAKKKVLVTLFNEPEGVEDAYAEKWAEEKGLTLKNGKPFAQNKDNIKVMIRSGESERVATELGFEYENMGVPVRVKERTVDEKGLMRSYHSSFRKSSKKAIRKAKSLIEKHRPDTLIIPYPKGSYHEDHRDAARILTAAILEYNREREARGENPVKLFLYATNITSNGFASYGIKPNVVNFFREEDQKKKGELFESYASQLHRNKEYPRLIRELDRESAVVCEEEYKRWGSPPEMLYAETLIKCTVGSSEHHLKAKQAKDRNKVNNSVDMIIDKLDELADSLAELKDRGNKVPMGHGYLRIHIFDKNVCYETKDEFEFLPVTIGGGQIAEIIEKMKMISIVIDPEQAKTNWKDTESLVRELITALLDDDKRFLKVFRDKKNTGILQAEAFSPQTISPQAIGYDAYKGIPIVYWRNIMREKLGGKKKIVVAGHQPGYHYYFGTLYKMNAADIFV